MSCQKSSSQIDCTRSQPTGNLIKLTCAGYTCEPEEELHLEGIRRRRNSLAANATRAERQIDAPQWRQQTSQCPGAAACDVNFNETDGIAFERPKHKDLRSYPTVSGLEAATLRDPDASSRRSDQGRCATDVCPGALFQA